jgi:hypothetical protein
MKTARRRNERNNERDNGMTKPVDSDQWAAVDALGRRVCDFGIAGPKRSGKTVAMFYWTWHQRDPRPSRRVKNISEIVRQHPEAMLDYGHPAWGDDKPGAFYWEEPLLGYYRTTDPWVLRKHAEMLADAGVDAVFFDCTNASLTWKDSYEALMATWDEARQDGVAVPKVAFMLPFWPRPASLVSLRQLYRDVYKARFHPDLWFVWKGKPCIMAYPDNLTGVPEDLEIARFFTFRPGQPDYVSGPARNDQWGWLENYPQHGYVKGADESFEEVPVGVAQNACPATGGHCSAFNLPGAFGRHFSRRKGFDPRPDGYLHGWNFQEQWDRAFEIDPDLVFVTGWNEFVAGQWLPENGWTGTPFSFVDQFDWAHSRDIEPNKGWGDRGDVYYLQLIDNVRRFKGMNPPEEASPPQSIRIGKADGWDGVAPYFRHHRGNTKHRDHRGDCEMHYVNKTGRNDITGAKVARDERRLYFYVETAEALTPPAGPHWMTLFLDVDRDKATGWNGYDYVINRLGPSGGRAIVERCAGRDWQWTRAGVAKFAVTANKLELEVERSLLGLVGADIDIEFKWNDNMQESGNIMDFYVHGDTAPGGRFNFVYSTRNGITG